MSYAFTLDVPADAKIYGEIREKLGTEAPAGLVAHLVQTREGGLRYTDVWESKAQWEAWREATLEPVVTGVLAGYGIPNTHDAVTLEEIDVIDTWVGT